MFMPIERPSRFKRLATGGVVAAGLALGALGVTPAEAKTHFREPEKREWAKPKESERVSDFVERGNDLEQREMFRKGLAEGKNAGPDPELEKIEKEHKKLMEKYKKGELSKKDVDDMISTLKKDGITLATGPELKKMGLVNDVAALPKYVWGLIVRGVGNVNDHYYLVGLAELIALFSYVQISRNARRRGLFRGIIEADREITKLEDFGGLKNWEKFVILPSLGLYTANYYVLGIILGSIASPYLRAQVVRLLQFLRRGGRGRGSRPTTEPSIPRSSPPPTTQGISPNDRLRRLGRK
jgi:hypothetical protein